MIHVFFFVDCGWRFKIVREWLIVVLEELVVLVTLCILLIGVILCAAEPNWMFIFLIRKNICERVPNGACTDYLLNYTVYHVDDVRASNRKLSLISRGVENLRYLHPQYCTNHQWCSLKYFTSLSALHYSSEIGNWWGAIYVLFNMMGCIFILEMTIYCINDSVFYNYQFIQVTEG